MKHLLIVLMLATCADASDIFRAPPTRKPTTKPVATKPSEFVSLLSMIQAVPAEMYPTTKAEWTELRAESVNAELKKAVVGKPGRLTFRAAAIEKTKGGIYDGLPRITAAVPEIGQTPVLLYAYFPAEAAADLARLKHGDEVTVSGKISRCDFCQLGDKWPFNVDLVDARLERKPKGRP
jgi:hypothetical protein